MLETEKKAIQSFNSGFNCAQSVLQSYACKMGMDTDLALSISNGFGAGMGRLLETCGAVTGAFMVIGLYNGQKYEDNSSRKEESFAMIQEFADKFKLVHGTTNCKALINCDLNTEEGQLYFDKNKIKDTICEKCISSSIKILYKLLED